MLVSKRVSENRGSKFGVCFTKVIAHSDTLLFKSYPLSDKRTDILLDILISDIMIIELETKEQDIACNEVNHLYELATKSKSVYARNVLKKCFDDGWQEIKKKMEMEGSVWYVWYMDGVNTYINRHFNNR